MSSTVVPRKLLRILVASALFTLWSVTLFGATATGVWVGTLSGQGTCALTSYSYTQPVSATLYQSADVFDGYMSSTGPQNPAPPAACANAGGDLMAVLQGTVSGSTLSGTLELQNGDIEFTGTLLEQTMSLQGNGANGSFKLDLTKTSEVVQPQFPSRYFSGTLSTQTDVTASCSNITTVTWSGPATGYLLAMQGFLIGSIAVSGGNHASPDAAKFCTIVPDAGLTIAVYGQVMGDSVMGVLIPQDATEPVPFTGTYSQNGNVFDGTGSGAHFGASFHLVAIEQPQPPRIVSFAATPSTIRKGQSATLSWQITGALSAWIDNNVGVATGATGSTVVSPEATTKYTLTAMSSGGSVSSAVTVTVDTITPTANVAVSSFPAGMLQAAGNAGGTAYYVLTNTGGVETSITLSRSGEFFTQSPSSFTIPAQSSRTVAITASAMPAGSYEGTSIPSGSGVPAGLTIPIRLVSATPPTSPVTASIVGTSRVEVADIAENNPVGHVSFSNGGSGTLYGLLTSDVPWLVPQSGVIEIPPGQTREFTFLADRSKRPDASAALGGMSGTITLTFFSGGGAGTRARVMGTTPTSSVSVSIVDVVKPGVTPGTPAALAGNEVALFVAGIASKSNAIGDVVLSNRGASSISDLKLFFSSGASGGSALSTALRSIPSNGGASFPGIVKNVFGSAAQSGVVQIRSGNASALSVSAVQVNTSNARLPLATALPVLRSDRAATVGQSVVLAGVRKDSAAHTDVYVQETTGAAANVTIDFLDGSGNVLSTRPADSIAPFGMLQVTDGVPANAKAARVRNTSPGTARVAAFALVVDDNTGDSWSIVDNASGTADTLYFPVPAPPQGNASREFYFTNSSASPVSVTLTLWAAAGQSRRRATAHASGGPSLEATDRTLTIAPLQTLSVNDLQSGFARVSAAAGALHSAGMYTTVRDSVRPYGAGIPAVPANWALAAGETKRFTGVEDSAPATVSSATPSTYRTRLLLVETGGQPATVRVTLRYLFAAGSLVTAVAASSRDLTLVANGSSELKDIGNAIIGDKRADYGDLHNMQLDVSVVSGSGKVLAFLQSIDNASGDVTIRE